MLTDLQLIDGFESLRAHFLESNPSAPALLVRSKTSGAGDSHSLEEILEAWLRAVLSLDDMRGQHHRELRALMRALASSEAKHETSSIGPLLSGLLRRNPAILESARATLTAIQTLKSGEDHYRIQGSFPHFAAEAAAWARILPKINGLKSWRFLANLGRPLIVPDAPIRRCFWRIGLLESSEGESRGDVQKAAACIDKVLQLTGIPVEEIERLLTWHTREQRGLAESNRCGRVPECESCAFQSCCLWARYNRAVPATAEAIGQYPAVPNTQKLKRRFDSKGGDNLDESELLALFFQGPQSGQAPMELAELLLRRFGGLKGIDASSIAELQESKGIGESKARQIKAAFELGRRLAAQPIQNGEPIGSSRDVYLAFRSRYRHIPQEHFITLLLDTKNRLIETCIVSKGSLNGSLTHPREVFKQAVRHSAAGVILIHNHPSGDPAPSNEDISVTKQLAEAGKILGIRVLDHIILGSETYYSFRDENRM